MTHPLDEVEINELKAELAAYKRVVGCAIPDHLLGRHDGRHPECVYCAHDRYQQHSVWLNTIAFGIAEALGDVPEGADQIEGNPVEQAERLIAENVALAARLDRVRKLHQPAPETGMGWRDDGTYDGIEPACATCGTADEYAVPWPCATARAADEQLTPTEQAQIAAFGAGLRQGIQEVGDVPR